MRSATSTAAEHSGPPPIADSLFQIDCKSEYSSIRHRSQRTSRLMNTLTTSRSPIVVDSPPWPTMPVPTYSVGIERFVAAAGHAGRSLPAIVHDALVRLRRRGPSVGRDAPSRAAGRRPPAYSPDADRTGRQGLGQRVHIADRRPPARPARRLRPGARWRPRSEHRADRGGARPPGLDLVARVICMFHTEAAFHPHRPRYLLLLCLRGDPAARTTLSSIARADHAASCPTSSRRCSSHGSAPQSTRATSTVAATCSAPRCRCFSGDSTRPSMVFDADLMVGIDEQANDALRLLGEATAQCHTSVALAVRRPVGRRQLHRRARPEPVHARGSTVPTGGCSGSSWSPTWRRAPLTVEARVITTHFGV